MKKCQVTGHPMSRPQYEEHLPYCKKCREAEQPNTPARRGVVELEMEALALQHMLAQDTNIVNFDAIAREINILSVRIDAFYRARKTSQVSGRYPILQTIQPANVFRSHKNR